MRAFTTRLEVFKPVDGLGLVVELEVEEVGVMVEVLGDMGPGEAVIGGDISACEDVDCPRARAANRR